MWRELGEWIVQFIKIAFVLGALFVVIYVGKWAVYEKVARDLLEDSSPPKYVNVDNSCFTDCVYDSQTQSLKYSADYCKRLCGY